MNQLLIFLYLLINIIANKGFFIETTKIVSIRHISVSKKRSNEEIKNFKLCFITKKDTICLSNNNIENLTVGKETKMMLYVDNLEIIVENVSKYLNKNKAEYKISIAIGEKETNLSEIEYYTEKGEVNYDLYNPSHDYETMNYIKFEIN